MFLQTNDRLVSLSNTSNIRILENNFRIVFNMNYTIELEKNGEYKAVSDYVYWDLNDEQNFNYAMEQLNTPFLLLNFIEYNEGFININEISSVKFAEKKLRVIFNLSHSVDFKSHGPNSSTKLTSEFVYVDFKSIDLYNTFTTAVKSRLKESNITSEEEL